MSSSEHWRGIADTTAPALRRWHLTVGRAVLFSGGEAESPTFDNERRTHLDTIVWQAADNPIIAAAHQIRAQQGHAVDWSWCKSAKRRGWRLPPGRQYRLVAAQGVHLGRVPS